MHEHLDRVSAIKAAVIAGNLDDVTDPAQWLATHEEPVWLPPVEDMRSNAARAAGAQDLTTAAAALSEIARACGECHQASGVQISMGYVKAPAPDLETTTLQMKRHLWAADRMWAGLIGPSDRAWQQGAEVLADVRLAAGDIRADSAQEKSVSDLTQGVRAIGVKAEQATSPESRSALYGEFLSQCANCHNLTGLGPAAL